MAKILPKGKKVAGTKKKDKIVWQNKSAWKKNLTVNAGAGNDVIDFSKSGKNNILIGGKGNDTIKTGKGKETVVINKGDGNDTIYHNAKQTTVQIKGAKANDTQEFTQKGKDLILTYSHAGTKIKEVITFKNYFTLKNQNIYLKTTKTQKLTDLINSKGLPMTVSTANTNITGTAFKDVITLNANNATVNGNAGNDDIILNATKANIKMTKGGGNDTLTITNSSLGTQGELNIEFDADAKLSYEKHNGDLIITGTHGSSESITLKDFFETTTGNYNPIGCPTEKYSSASIIQGNNKNNIINTLYEAPNNEILTVKGDANTNNELSGTFAYNNTIIGGNKTDIMYSYIGTGGYNTTFITGKQGTSYIEGYGYSEKYIVSSLNTKTIINDMGYYDEDSVQINGVDVNNFYMYFDIHGSSKNNDLFLMTGSQLTSNLSGNKFETPYTWKEGHSQNYAFNMSDVTVNIDGLMLEDYFYYSSGGYKYQIDNITIADSNGNNAKLINKNTLNKAADELQGRVKWYVNEQEFSDSKALLTAIKQTMDSSTATASQKADAQSQLTTLTNLYKSVKLGTDGNDTFNITEGAALPHNYKNKIYSGKGNDTFNFNNVSGTVEIEADSKILGLAPANTDTLIFNDVSIEETTLFPCFETLLYSTSDAGNINFVGIGDNAYIIKYTGFFRDDDFPVNAKNLIIKDKYRSYDVNYMPSAVDEIDYSKENNNNIVYMKGTKTVTLNNKYNFVTTTNSDTGSHKINYRGGHDVYSLAGNSNDTYNADDEYYDDMHLSILDYKGNDTYNIKCSYYSSILIQDDNGTDVLNLYGTNNWSRLFFNVKRDNTTNGDLLIIKHNDNLTAENVMDKKNAKGVRICNYFSDGKIETINFKSSSSANLTSWIDGIKGHVSAWLNSNYSQKGYESTSDVLNSGNKDDINAILSCYNYSYSNYDN